MEWRGGGSNLTGGFKDFEKLLNEVGGQNKQGMGTKYKTEETKIHNVGLSLNTLLTLHNIGISSTLRSCL